MPETTDPEAVRFALAFQQFLQDMHHLAGQGVQEDRLRRALAEHFGRPTDQLPVVDESFTPSDHPNLQLAFDALCATSPGWQLFGLPVEVLHWMGFGLANIANPSPTGPHFEAVAPGYLNVAVDVDRTMACVSVGVYLLHHEGSPVAALLARADPHHGGELLKVDVMAPTREHAVAFLARLRQLAHEHNVHRGKVLSFNFTDEGWFGLAFHRLPVVERTDVILPEADLVAIERHTVDLAAKADVLRAAGRHLKRGLLLYGPPGTGKTHAVTYLCNRMAGRTVVLLSGQAAPTLGQAAAIARSLQPSMLVLEDVDLVAMERMSHGMGANPLLFQLLNEMDGLAEDADVIFVLTTNRVELLEPALANRPGRIDQAVEIRLPDADCRSRLFERYLRGMTTEIGDLTPFVDRTEGVSAAFIKELGRRAALLAADDLDPTTGLVVTAAHLDGALTDLLEHSAPTVRRILGAVTDGPPPPDGPWPDEADGGGAFVAHPQRFRRP